VVDDLDGDLAGLGLGERTRDRRVDGGPSLVADVGAQGAAELVVGVVGSREVGVADDEGLAVVVGVQEPGAWRTVRRPSVVASSPAIGSKAKPVVKAVP
jgi:hypothetical protein